MDITSLYYFAETTKDLNITRTAARLFVSQQTLSNHIQRLENYFGAELFHRRPSLSLTAAGEHVLAFASAVAKEHTDVKDILSDIEKQERGVLRIGASLSRGNTILPQILPLFSARYPNIEIRFIGANSAELRQLVLKRELDFAVVLGTDHTPKLETRHLLNEQIYLCVSNRLLETWYPEDAADLKARSATGARIKDFSRLPFALFSNHLGDQIQLCFDEAGVKPIPYMTGTFRYISAPLCSQGLCAIFLTQMGLSDQAIRLSADVNIFPLLYRGVPMIQPLSLIRMKDRYFSQYAEFFTNTLCAYFSELAPVELGFSV